MKLRRRRILEAVGVSGLLTLAGCGSSGDADADRRTRTDTTSDDGAPTRSPTGTRTPTRTGTRTPTRTVAPDLAYSLDSKLAAADGAGEDNFGSAVALSDDGSTALVAAERDTLSGEGRFFAGSAYVFARAGDGWTQETKLAPDGVDGVDAFGSSVALAGDGTTALVGASEDEDPNGEKAGSAYVFARSDGSWTRRAKLAPDDGDPEDGFGVAVAIDETGGRALVGAPADDRSAGEKAGSVYEFARNDGEWVQRGTFAADDGDGTDFFGTSVALADDGTTALVGAWGDEDPHGNAGGSAYVFAREGGSWTQRAKLAAADGDERDRFGFSVALAGDGTTALIGTFADEDPNGKRSGSAYVFARDDGEWTQRAKLAAADGDESDYFGKAVALAGGGGLALVGSARTDVGGDDSDRVNAGSAYVFVRDGGDWTQRTVLASGDRNRRDRFGSSVALADGRSTALVGAEGEEKPNGDGAGAAYVFEP